jgi:hypothetical protein
MTFGGRSSYGRMSPGRHRAFRFSLILLGVLLVMAFPQSRHAVTAPFHATRAATAATADYAGPVGPGRTGFAVAVLNGLDVKATTPDVDAMDVWEAAEGGGFGNQAANNPLNINPGTAPWPGHPADGAWAFPSLRDGIDYTIIYLHYSNYTGILAALRNGTSEHAVLYAIVTSPWASSHYAGNKTMQYALTHTS